ncbi:MAG: 16S rRNA (guanine(527)-N(7))-methyltransferase RsmG [Pseudomonadota bacterium]|jgi:16S rRNA (guanine527-N7)-methyltransferase|uniref:rRNA small subunit 7-methylguanosine (M7G) methyltransferase GidB n=1 Tax=hydrothermal vent metagenome TaxID=652676 RepID=A0A160TN96_9ZZZZ
MTEDDARGWIRERFGAKGEGRMAEFARLLIDESARQNLIAPSTLESIWSRHIVDSAQLIGLAAGNEGDWLDIGSGAGFPGLVVAALTERRTVLVEPRKRRVEFLQAAAETLGIASRVSVIAGKVESVSEPVAVISARAVAQLNALLASAVQCSRRKTLWILPKGRTAREEVAVAEQTWHGVFHVEQSITDPESLIVLAKGVSRR